MAPEQCEKCEVFSDIHVNNWAKLLRYAKANRNSAGVAEELVQDTFHDAWSKFDELVSHENIGGWLMQTLKNKIWNYTRAKQREANMIIGHGGKTEDIAATDNFVNELFARNALSAIHRFVHDTFNEDDITLFRRIIIENASHKEAAAELGITVWTSQKRLERIRKRIREEFPDF